MGLIGLGDLGFVEAMLPFAPAVITPLGIANKRSDDREKRRRKRAAVLASAAAEQRRLEEERLQKEREEQARYLAFQAEVQNAKAVIHEAAGVVRRSAQQIEDEERVLLAREAEHMTQLALLRERVGAVQGIRARSEETLELLATTAGGLLSTDPSEHRRYMDELAALSHKARTDSHQARRYERGLAGLG